MRNLSRQITARKGVLALVMMAVFILTAPALARQEVNDQTIADTIEDEMLFDASVPANEIHIGVQEGVVTLDGSANNLLAKKRAAKIASSVKGVQSVVNEIEVDPYWGRMDWEIERDVEDALLYDPATESYEVEVSVLDNKATLTGNVDSWHEKKLAEKTVAGVKGVAAVDNNIAVEYTEDRMDSEIRQEVEALLSMHTLIDDALIDVKVSNGKVNLTGVVGSFSEKSLAHGEAWVAGVRQVNTDGLKVKNWARDENLRKDKYVDKTDAELEKAIETALLYDARVKSFNVQADVSYGVATLRGTVDNINSKKAAGQTARNTVGVSSVVNRIKVRPDAVADATIAESVRDALERNPYVERYEIDVSVIDSEVYLTGTVDSTFEKAEASDLAATAYGATEIHNNLDVGSPTEIVTYDPYVYDYYPYGYGWYSYEPEVTTVTDNQIKESINDELFWSPFVNSEDVKVQVDNGEATLKGEVSSWSDYHAATQEAYEGGAILVFNNLEVQ